jgi:hypothetical protein
MNSNNPVVAIAEEIAAREGTDASRLDPPLHEAVDTDALESLLSASGHADVELRFDYSGYRVRVRADGTVTVSELEPPTV